MAREPLVQRARCPSARLLVAVLAVCTAIGTALWLRSPPVRTREPNDRGEGVTVYVNATFWTGEDYAAAMAVEQTGRIGCVGSRQAVLLWAGPKARVVDLQGRHVIPGMHDPHVHLLKGGMALDAADLSALDSVEALKAAVRDACDKPAMGGWVLAMGWDEAAWGGEQPHRAWLDSVCPDKPVLLLRMCSHKVLINTKAAEVVGLTASTPDPEGGRIYRDASGDFTGVLSENAMTLATGRLPRPTLQEKRRLLLQAAQHLASKGVTFAHDMGNLPPDAEEAFDTLSRVLRPLAEAGELPIRLFAFTPLSSWQRLAAYVRANGTADASRHLHWGGLKEFADGSLGSGTALFHQSYHDDPSTAGIRTIPEAQLRQLTAEAHATGLQVAIHAIGDLALDSVVDAFGHAGAASMSSAGSRHRVEHAQHLAGPQAAARLAAAGLRVVANPLHLLPDRRVLAARLGEQRAGAGRSYAFRTMLQAGVKMAFGSDWPVVGAEPLLGLFVAAFRHAPGEPQAFVPEEAVSLREALHATTAGAAALAGLEGELGSLRAGMLADFVVLDSDPLAMRPGSALPAVQQTYVGGRCVYGCSQAGLWMLQRPGMLLRVILRRVYMPRGGGG